MVHLVYIPVGLVILVVRGLLLLLVLVELAQEEAVPVARGVDTVLAVYQDLVAMAQ